MKQLKGSCADVFRVSSARLIGRVGQEGKRKRLVRARAMMDQSDSDRIAALLDDFNTVAWPH
jgi:hypothetical protein